MTKNGIEKGLILRIKLSDREAFDRLCRTCYPPLLKYAGLLLHSDWAEDVVQDVLYEVWCTRERLNVEGNLMGYLLRSVYNRSINIFKRRGVNGKYLSDAKLEIFRLTHEYLSPDNNPVIQAVFANDRHRQLDAAVKSLSPRTREVFELSFYKGLPNSKISELLGIDKRTVENHRYLALRQLRTAMQVD